MSDRSFPIFSVGDLPRTQRFYEHLGFVETYRFPEAGEAGFVTLDRDGATLALATSDGSGEHVAQWVYVDDVDRVVSEMRNHGAEIVAEPHDEPWGERVATVRDPAGTLVHLGARD